MAHRNILLVTEKTHLISWEDITVCGQILHTTLKSLTFMLCLKPAQTLPVWELQLLILLLPRDTLDFTFHICCIFSPWYFSIFYCSFFPMLQSAGIATSITTEVFCSLSATTLSGWFPSSCLSQTLDRISRRKWMDNHRMKKLEWWQL